MERGIRALIAQMTLVGEFTEEMLDEVLSQVNAR